MFFMDVNLCGSAGCGNRYDGGGISVVLASLFAALDGSDGLRPGRQGGIEKMQKSAGKSYGISFLGQPGVSIRAGENHPGFTTVNTARYGMKVGFAVWLGFVATVQLTANAFRQQPPKLYLINTGYQMICYLAMGAILAVWRGRLRYSISSPPVTEEQFADASVTLHQRSSSPTIFSVATGPSNSPCRSRRRLHPPT